MGRCYRGMWQGGRVAVKIIDCISEADSRSTSSALASTELAPGASSGSRALSGSNGLSGKRPARGMCAQAAMVEALLARSMGHPHIVTTFAHGVGVQEQVDGDGASHQQVWIVQEFCNRGSLFEAVDRGMLQLQGGSGPDLRAVLATAQEIAGALTYLHAHDVLHGDLTPSNVLLTSSTKDGRRWQAKVNDFGLAAVMGGADAVRRSCRLGTVTHMPPEVVQHGTLSKATDVWSFGMILLEMLTGQRAWMGLHYGQIIRQVGEGHLPMSIPSDIPPGLASLVRRCLSRDPSQRPDFPTILAEVQRLKDTIFSRPPSQEASRPDMVSPRQQQRASGRPRGQPLPPPQPLSAEEREQQREKQRQLIREQEEWLQRQLDPSAAAASPKPAQMVVVPPVRAPSLPSPFAAALAPAPSLPSPFAAAPERAPSLPQPAGSQ
jgi:serine/threonine protein kinase